ncbi:acylphosphatase [Diaminobutyricibacter tongyongensis]|uniref:acylphosphatase n=1 Tax=Leifsonia tongyongensis TaxID=1268043 RepID=A0A6L9Y1J4_9MICO|nr:acylphosphatase [Diaminobutyricibacter tongyongensis]NEN07128.1 acylphosphatase [Diaminobutyricibacter tongyongensis]
MIRKRVVVTGVVQGVGFRWSARETARRIGVAGFAFNRADGAVELEVEGEPAAIERMLTWLADGPPGSRVTAIDVSDLEPVGDDAFRIIARQ